MSQLPLLSPASPPAVADVDLRLCDAADLAGAVAGAALVHADPPWTYANAGARGVAANEYGLLSMTDIVRHVGAFYDSASADARLILWTTWPQLGAWMEATRGWRWGAPVTGGSWHKMGSPGVGFHWLGNSEPVLVYVKGSPDTCRNETVLNAHGSFREAHSEKPTDWLRLMLRRWTRPGDLVVDVYAGLAPMARACVAEGRMYVGCEIDEERHHQARALLAGFLSNHGGAP